jgi:hypothetical protein
MPNRSRGDDLASQAQTALDPPDSGASELRTLVTVSRQHPKDFGDRQIVIRIDDDPKVNLMFGESFTREVGPGAHRLRAHNTLFWKTIHFTVEPGEHIEFIVINRGTPLTLGLAGVLGAAPLYLDVHQRSVE